jgi:hypothetical protein
VSATDITWIDKPGNVPGCRVLRGEMAGAYAECPYSEELMPEVKGFLVRSVEQHLVGLLGYDPRRKIRG